MPRYCTPEAFATLFWSKVIHGDGCWQWAGTFFSRGYGRIKYRYKSLLAHRVAWELTNGPIPEAMCVCHHCDNPACVRPDHLFLGTAADNNRDRNTKGRQARGDRSGPRLYPERLSRGDNHHFRRNPELAPRGEAHFLRRHPEMAMKGERNGNARLTWEQVREIRHRYAAGGITQEALGREYGIKKPTVSGIIVGRSWIE